jgi:hypothetical protein
MTANDMIRQALRMAGVLASEETPTAVMAADGLITLNNLLQSMGATAFGSVSWPQTSFTLTANDGSYTIGSGGDINTQRPTAIYEAHVSYGGVDYPLKPMALEDYERISIKGVSGIPATITIRPGYPLSTLLIYPAPSDVMTLVIDRVAPVADYALNDTMNIPAHWNRGIRALLAVEYCAEYGIEPASAIVAIANEGKRAILRSNVQIPDAQFDPLLMRASHTSGYPEILKG